MTECFLKSRHKVPDNVEVTQLQSYPRIRFSTVRIPSKISHTFVLILNKSRCSCWSVDKKLTVYILTDHNNSWPYMVVTPSITYSQLALAIHSWIRYFFTSYSTASFFSISKASAANFSTCSNSATALSFASEFLGFGDIHEFHEDLLFFLSS